MSKKSLAAFVLTAVFGISALVPAFALAASGRGRPEDGRVPQIPNGVHGQIIAISGTTITLAQPGIQSNQGTTTYTVDATNAFVMKNRATTTISALVVGDRAGVEGAISGTSVIATKIMVGEMRGWGMGSTTMPQGNGKPARGYGFFRGIGDFFKHRLGF